VIFSFFKGAKALESRTPCTMYIQAVPDANVIQIKNVDLDRNEKRKKTTNMTNYQQLVK
jgi:hypothetical protein